MRGLLLLIILTIVACCVHYASAQWPKWVLTKGVICEERCKKIKNCDPLNEFSACKCFPRQYVKKWLQYNTLPMEPHLVCLMSVAGVVPKCCDIYKKEKDSYKNCASEIEDANEELKKSYDAKIDELNNGHGAEMVDMKKKLGSCEQDGEDRTSNLTAEMLVLILEQNRNQNKELEQLKIRLDNEQERTGQLENSIEEKSGQLDKRLDTEIAQVEARLDFEFWKPFATQLVNSVSSRLSQHIGFSVYMTETTWPPKNSIVKFQEGTNDGNGYSFATGIFSCPVAGTYLFTFSICHLGNSILVVKLMVNDIMKTEALTDPKRAFVQGSNTVLQRLQKGDLVSLETRDAGGNLYGTNELHVNTFAGVLLYN